MSLGVVYKCWVWQAMISFAIFATVATIIIGGGKVALVSHSGDQLKRGANDMQKMSHGPERFSFNLNANSVGLRSSITVIGELGVWSWHFQYRTQGYISEHGLEWTTT